MKFTSIFLGLCTKQGFLVFVFGILRKLLVPHTQNVDHFAKDFKSEGLREFFIPLKKGRNQKYFWPQKKDVLRRPSL